MPQAAPPKAQHCPGLAALRALALAVPAFGLLFGCAIATPYRETASGRAVAATRIEIVAITEATLSKDGKARSAFWEGVRRVEDDLPNQPGLLGYSLRRELLGDRVWTMTVWASEADLTRFVTAPAHAQAMAMGRGALVDLRFAQISRNRGPARVTWSESLAALESGRPANE